MIVEVLLAVLATTGFSILFAAPRNQWLFCGLTGGVAWLVNTLLKTAGAGPFLSTFCATLALMVISRFLATRRKTPVTVFLIAGIFPLVPGAGLYYTAYYLFISDFSSCLAKGVETLKYAGVITLGILIGSALPRRLFNWVSPKS